MKRWSGGTSSPVWGLPSGPRGTRGASSRSGTNTVAPPLTVWSTPWSKNWPKKVNKLLYGGDRPTSVVTLGMNRVLNGGVQITAVGVATGTTGQGTAVAVGSCDRTGAPAAATAAGLVE